MAPCGVQNVDLAHLKILVTGSAGHLGEALKRGLLDRAHEAVGMERSCRVRDPFGHQWRLGHAIGKIEVAEMRRRCDAMRANVGG